MFKTAAIAALVLLDDIKPKPIPRAEEYVSKRVPMLGLVEDLPTLPLSRRKPAKRRKRRVNTWTDQEVWGACAFALLLGILIGVCI